MLPDQISIGDNIITKTDFSRDGFEKLIVTYLKCRNSVVSKIASSQTPASNTKFSGFLGLGVGYLNFSGIDNSGLGDKLGGLVQSEFGGVLTIQGGSLLKLCLNRTPDCRLGAS